MSISVSNIDVFLLVLVRITGFFVTAPFFSIKPVPMKVKTGLSIMISFLIFFTIDDTKLEYVGVIGYGLLVVSEALVGAIMGLFANIAYHIISFAGNFIDTEIGFSMVNTLDKTTNVQTTISSNLYGYAVLIMMIITNLHHYFLRAIIDSFQVIGVSKAEFNPNIYRLMVNFIGEFFVIGFRIVLPIFASILLVNVLLAILAKVAPQLNMFVIGFQLKIFVGLFIFILMMDLIPSVADFIFNEMIDLLKRSIEYMIPLG